MEEKFTLKENLEYYLEVATESIHNFFCRLWYTLTKPLKRKFKMWGAKRILSPSHFKCYQILDWANHCPNFGNAFTLTELKDHFGAEYEREINWCIYKEFLVDFIADDGRRKFMLGLAPLLDEEFGMFFGW